MAKEKVYAECLCITSTQADYNHYTKGRTYTLELNWAKRRDILKYFEPQKEVASAEMQDNVEGGMILEKGVDKLSPEELAQEKQKRIDDQKIQDEKDAEEAFEEEKRRLKRADNIKKAKERAAVEHKDQKEEDKDPAGDKNPKK